MGNAENNPLAVAGHHCRNCGAALAGEFCQQCGQRERDVQLADVVGEAMADVTDLDSRLWRTLRLLLLRPGQVTADYIAGRRARYIPPVRLYLVMSFLVFLIASLTGDQVSIQTGAVPPPDSAATSEEGIYITLTTEDGNSEVLTLREYLETDAVVEASEELPRWLRPLFEQLLENASILERDPTVFTRQLTNRIPQMMFVLLPLFALMMMLFYRGSPFHYLQHLIFSLHYHTVAFMLFLLLWPLRMLLPGDYGGLVILALLVYLPLALKRAYGSSTAVAVGKGMALGVSYYLLVTFAGTLVALTTLVFL